MISKVSLKFALFNENVSIQNDFNEGLNEGVNDEKKFNDYYVEFILYDHC